MGDERVFPPHRPQPPCALRGHFLGPGIPRHLRYGKPDVYPGGRHQKVSGRAPGKALYHVRVQPRHGQQLRRHHRLHRVRLRRAAVSGRVYLGVHGPRHCSDKPGRQARLCLWRRLWRPPHRPGILRGRPCAARPPQHPQNGRSQGGLRTAENHPDRHRSRDREPESLYRPERLRPCVCILGQRQASAPGGAAGRLCARQGCTHCVPVPSAGNRACLHDRYRYPAGCKARHPGGL